MLVVPDTLEDPRFRDNPARHRRACARRCGRMTPSGRFGGEEFLAVLPRCDGRAALTIAERTRGKVEAERFETTSGVVRATLSLGVATLAAAPGVDAPELIEVADRALYRAKAAGRNRVAIAA